MTVPGDRWSNEPTVPMHSVEPKHAARPGQQSYPPQPGQPGQPGYGSQPGQPGYAPQPGQPGYGPQPGQPGYRAGPVHPAELPTVVLPVVPAGAGGPGGPGGPAAPAAAELDDSTGSVARNSGAMAIGSLVSRGTGFLRAAAIGAAVGGAAVGDSYNLANTLPNMVYTLLLDGVLASVLIPMLVRARKSEPDRGQAYAQRLLTLAVVAIGAATVIVVIAAPIFTALLTNKHTPANNRGLITTLAYLLLPEIFFYGLAGIFAAILNVRGHFAAPMWTPILNNVVVIATVSVFAVMRRGEGPLTPGSITTNQVLVLGIGTTVGIVVQAFGLWPALRRVGFTWAWRWDFRALHLGELGRLGAWTLLSVAVNQIGIMVVLKIATLAGSRGAAGPIIYNNAFLIFMMAHGIVAVSVITAIMPRMAAAAADGKIGDLVDQLSQGTRLAAVVLMPAAALYITLGRPLAVTLFQWGNYSHREAVGTGWVITMAGIGLVPYAISQLQSSALYALRDTRSAALINVPVVAVRILMDVVFYVVLPIAAVTASLMFGTAASFLLALVIGYWVLRRKAGRLGLRRVADTLVRLAVAAGIAAVPVFILAWMIGRLMGDGKIASMVQLTLGGVLLIVLYALLATMFRVREAAQFGGMIRRRLGR
jgi:putative peptidoglycan lipid II flippase